MAIEELSAYPIQHDASPEAVRQQLIGRGREVERYAGMHLCCYNGIALEQTDFGVDRYNIEGRVVVDTKTFHRINANYAFSLRPFNSDGKKQKNRHRDFDFDDGYNDKETANTLDLIPMDKLELVPLTDDQCLLANPTVRGFSFSEKRWLDFFVGKLENPAWN